MAALVDTFTWLATILALVAGFAGLSVALSFSIARAQRIKAAALADRHRPFLAVRLLAAEYACLLLTILLRPLGWLPIRIPTGAARRPPVILLHGLFQNRSCLLPLAWYLRRAGFDCVVSINTPAWHDLAALTERVRCTVAQVRTATGAVQVHLVGHSMGGITARAFLQRQDGAAKVAGCVTLGSPHRGSRLARLAVSRLGRSLLPGSEFLTRLNAAPLPKQTHFTAIYSRHDNIIVPMENARLDGAHNIELTGLGHTTLLFSAKAAHAVITALNNSDQPGL
jgi:triacylglycerol esterase/lipase EstA (alpha/beta hydrolase family)